MAEPRVDNSCQKWRAISSANLPKPCPPGCFNPLLEETCPEPISIIRQKSSIRLIKSIKHSQSIIQPIKEVVLEPEECIEGGPFGRSYFDKIDTKALCAKCFDPQERTCDLCEAQQANFNGNACSAKCRPLKTFLHLMEVV